MKLSKPLFLILALTAVFCCEPQTDYSAIARERQQVVKDSLDAHRDTTSSKQQPDPEPEDTSSVARTTPFIIPSDLFLVYGGSKARNPYRIEKDRAIEVLSYTDTAGVTHWLYDGILLLELKTHSTTAGRSFGAGYGTWDGQPMLSATKKEWQGQIDYYFAEGTGLDAYELAAEEIAQKIGEPSKKVAVFIMIPEPISRANWFDEMSSPIYWGKIDGVEMNFSKSAHRILACQWWVEQVAREFKKKDYKYLDLSGFYWFAEQIDDTKSVVMKTAKYCHDLNYAFTWIPYFHATGYNEWKTFGFDFAYYQPNYFFYNVDETRISVACSEAARYGMYMEMEFDERVLASSTDNRADRLRSYMKGFEDCGAWANQKMAYYAVCLHSLAVSNNEADKQLYHEFCDWVVSRPCRDSH